MTHKQDTAHAGNGSSKPLQMLFRKAVSFIDTPRKHWPIVAKLYRWVLAGGPIEHQHIAEYNLARNLQEQGKYEEAIEHYRLSVTLKPDFGWALNNMGIIFCLMGRFSESEECYKRALQLDGRHAKARCNLADLYLRQGRLADAEREVLQALDINPEAPITIHTHAQILAKNQQGQEAERKYRHALALAPENLVLLEDFAEFLASQGREQEAGTYAEKAGELKQRGAEPIPGANEWVKETESHFNKQKGDDTNVGK